MIYFEEFSLSLLLLFYLLLIFFNIMSEHEVFKLKKELVDLRK